MIWLNQGVRRSHRKILALMVAGILLLLLLSPSFPGLMRSGFSSPRGWSEIRALIPRQVWVSSPTVAPFGEGYAMATVALQEDEFALAWLSPAQPGPPPDEATSLVWTAKPAAEPRLAMESGRQEGHVAWLELGLEGKQQLWYGNFRPGTPIEHPAPITTLGDPIPSYSLATDSSGKPHLVWTRSLETGYSVVYHTTIGEKGIRTKSLSQDRRMPVSPALWSENGDVYIVWVETQPDPRQDSLVFSRLGSDGQTIAQPTPVDTGMGPVRKPTLVPADRGALLLIWATDDVGLSGQSRGSLGRFIGPFGRCPGERLRGMLLDASGQSLTDPVTLARSRRPLGDYHVARDADGGYHLAWSELGPEGWSVWHRKIRTRLKPTGPAVELSEPGLGGSRVQIVSTSPGHVQVFWTNTASTGTMVLTRWK